MDNQVDFMKFALDLSNDPLTLAASPQLPIIRDDGTASSLVRRSHMVTYSECTFTTVQHLRLMTPKFFSLAAVTITTTDLLETLRKGTREAILPLLR